MKVSNNLEMGDLISEYGNSQLKSGWELVIGIVGIFYSVWLIIQNEDVIIWAIILLILSLFMIVSSVIRLLDIKPIIIIYQKGIWLRKYGFIGWQEIKKVETISISSSKSRRLKLQIFLLSVNDIDSIKPDYHIDISNIENNYGLSDLMKEKLKELEKL